MKNILFLVLGSIALCGCQTPPPAPNVEASRVIQKPYDQVWPVIVQAVSAQDYPMKIVQKDSGIIETENFSPGILRGAATPPRGLFLPAWGQTRARLSILATPSGTNATNVKVVGHFEGFEYNVTHEWFVWNSTGQFENQFLNKVGASF